MEIRDSAEHGQRKKPASAEQKLPTAADALDDQLGALQLSIDASSRIVSQRRTLESLFGPTRDYATVQLMTAGATASTTRGTVQRIRIDDYDTDDEETFKLALEEMGRKGDVDSLRRYHAILGKIVDSVDYGTVDYQDPKPFRLLSVAKLALAKLEPTPDAVSLNQQIYLLPKSEWWRLFIDARYHSERDPLKFDYQQSPGFFSAMMAAFEAVFGAPPEKPAQRSGISAFMGSIAAEFSSLISSGPERITPKLYQYYHDLVRRKVLTQLGGTPRFSTIEFGWSNTSTNFGANEVGGVEPDAAALSELILEGIAYIENPELFPDPLPTPRSGAFVAIRIMFDSLTGQRLFHCVCKFSEKQAPAIIEGIFARYYAEVGKAKRNRHLVITAIVRLIRNLHVGHFFTDANGRINIMLLLNKFLMENNLSPVILTVNPGVFGGLLSIKDLVETVEAGITNFHNTVRRLQVDAVVGNAFDLDDEEESSPSGLGLGLGVLGPSTSSSSGEMGSSLGLGLGLGSSEASSSSSVGLRAPIVDVFRPFDTPFAVNDPSIRSLGECFWDTLRRYGISEEELAKAASMSGLTVDSDVFLDMAGAFIDALNKIKNTNFCLMVDQFNIKTGKGMTQSKLGSGSGPAIQIGFAVDPDSGLGHFIPPYRG